jgi:hypothetical protein
MQTLILASLALAAVALVWNLRRRLVAQLAGPEVAARAAGRPAAAPAAVVRIANPRRANRPDVKVWVLKADARCELTHEFLHNRRYRTEEAVALPAVGCNLSGCHCRYEPVSDTRRRDRRHDDERRNAIRFEQRTDRRGHQDRRQNDVWQHGSLR